MRKDLVIIVLVGVCLAFSEAAAKNKKKKPASGGKPLPGGFQNADANNPDVKAAADFVLSEIKKDAACTGVTLVEVTKAKHKVVAGSVYDLKLKFKTAANKVKKCKVMVMRDLPDTASGKTVGEHKLMSSGKAKSKPSKKDCACVNFTN
uniref:Krichin n=1 Tax=Sinohyriopsis cumingii TaxID=165450 RepID=A0A2D1QTZ0_SINCU|nr:Krichin [Sinohyriopsis cumingii]